MNKIKLLNQSGMTMVNDYKDEMPLELLRNKYAPEMYFDESELFVTEYQYNKPILEVPRNSSQVASVLARNGEELHKALRHLPNSMLLNERFWLWLSLVEYHEFITKSMKAGKGSATQVVNNFENTVLLGKDKYTTNYLFSMFWLTDRAATADDGYDYSRIKVVFEHISNFKLFMKLPFANSRLITECFVDFMHLPKYSNLSLAFYNELLKMFNEVAGLLLIDSLDKEEISMLMRQIAEEIIANPQLLIEAEEEIKPKAKPKAKPKKKKKAAPKVKVEKVVEEEASSDDYYEEESVDEEPEYEEEAYEEEKPKDDLDSLLERQREAQLEREERDREEEWKRNNSSSKKNSFLDED